MATKNTIRRSYLILKRVREGKYPSKHDLMSCIANSDAEVSFRTLQRDLANIRSNFDIEVLYDAEQGGYYLQEDSTNDFDKLLYFLDLAESSDIILSTLSQKREALKHVSISPNPRAKGAENIGTMLRAIQQQQIISFEHFSYQSGEARSFTAHPYLLKEFEGMWYLFAYVPEVGAFRTFGLDRISKIVVSEQKFERTAELELTAEKFNSVYGLVYEPDNDKNAPTQSIKLRFSNTMLPYLSALPLHHTQEIENDVLSLSVIINPEIENKIIGYGEHVEVLSPPHLREKIKERLTAALSKY